ncbi:hypothetical protein CJF42_21900 [Pseudoalteromonas sp. NBT06-2]|uniref:SRPBCC family protein n=1 Tax=Pseudoalteromonas sp. NBT06-2 TaxID=2025950 RepID=UPI000BA6EA97|nr:SRPBCC family protein [Pseudoalteromonas sp. NBT06-2]PAJ72303.1 hypothetical protein CJF42_21900 [Pseudoalteromonas sp. NBT06-2]
MERLLKYAFIFLLSFIIIGLFLPTQYNIKKSISINSSPLYIHYWVNDFKYWSTWSPWTIIDPSFKITLGEKTKGVGANLTWSGQSGNGELTVTQVNNLSVHYNIIFNSEHLATSSFSYKKERNNTTVTWQIEGNNHATVIAGYQVLLIKYVIAPSLELGLKNLKSQTEMNSAIKSDSENGT